MEVRKEIRKEIVDFFEDEFFEDDFCFLDGLDDAIAGAVCVDGVPLVVYGINAIIKILMHRDGMDREEAWKYFFHNIRCVHFGEKTPLFMEQFPID